MERKNKNKKNNIKSRKITACLSKEQEKNNINGNHCCLSSCLYVVVNKSQLIYSEYTERNLYKVSRSLNLEIVSFYVLVLREKKKYDLKGC